MIGNGTTVWVVSGSDRDGYAVYGVYATEEEGTEAGELIEETDMSENVTIPREHAEQIATATDPYARAAELGYGTLSPESVTGIENWVAAGCPTAR